jgi:hypothetical protein
MTKRRAGSQIDNLIPNHKKSRIDSISLHPGGVKHTVRKLLTRAITLLHISSQSQVCTQSYGASKLQESQLLAISRLPFGSLETKCHLHVGLMERHIIYYKKEGGGFPQVWAMGSLVSPNLPMVYPSTKSVPTMH